MQINEVEIYCKYDALIDFDDFVPHEMNTNDHPKEQVELLAKLIKKNGVRLPIIISNLSKKCVAGHGRYLAFRSLGMDKIPVVYQDFEDVIAEYRFLESDNHIARYAEFNESKMLDNLKELDLDVTTLDFQEIGLLDFELPQVEVIGETEDDAIPEVKHDPVTKRGDIWLLGDHRVMNGDSTMIDDVEKLMKGEKADMVFTDPPYNQETEGGCKGEIGKSLKKQSSEIESMCNFNPEEFLDVLPIVFSKGKMNASVFCNKDLVVDYLGWARDSGYAYNILFWKKPNAIPLGGSYRPDVEYLLVFRKNGIFNSGLKELSYSKCLEYPREVNKVHPTMKPVAMIENQIKICSNKSVVDLFLGSGSTLIACEKTNRKCYGMELDETYVQVIIERWQNFTGKEAKLEATGQTYNSLVKTN